MTATKKAQATSTSGLTRSLRDEVALGNGMTADQLPRFKRHVHPETGEGTHTSWQDCALTLCTWAGSTAAHAAPTSKLAARIKDAAATGKVVELTIAEPPTPRRNAERRNEVPHDDALAAVNGFGCKTCGARPTFLCFAKSGQPTNHVHADRMHKLDEARS